MELLKFYLGAMVGLGFLYFMAIRLISTRNYKRKSLYMLAVGVGLLVVMIFYMQFDADIPPFSFINWYWAFPIVDVVFTIASFITYFVIGMRSNQRIRGFRRPKNRKVKTAKTARVKEVNEYIYLAIKYHNSYLLKKMTDKAGDKYFSPLFKFSRNIYFRDEMMNKIKETLHLELLSQNYVGKATLNKKKKKVEYFCYEVEIASVPDTLLTYTKIEKADLYNYNLNDFNKNILYRIILNDKFDIKL